MSEGSSKSFTYSASVAKDAVDRYGHMNNAAYLKLFEQARWAMAEETGVFTSDEVDRTKIGPIIIELTLKFRKEVKEGTPLKIVSKPVGFKRQFGVIEQFMYGPSDLLVCWACFTVVLFDMKQRSILPAPKRWRDALGVS